MNIIKNKTNNMRKLNVAKDGGKNFPKKNAFLFNDFFEGNQWFYALVRTSEFFRYEM